MSSGPADRPAANPTSSNTSSSLDVIKNFATEVGNKISQAASAVERGVHDVMAMFPVVDLTADHPVPPLVYHYGDVDPAAAAMPSSFLQVRPCPTCTYAGSPAKASNCAVCQSPLPLSTQNGARKPPADAAKQPKSSLYPSLSICDNDTSMKTNDKDCIIVSERSGPRGLPQNQDPSTWTCPKCTLRNANTEARCSACGSGAGDGSVRRVSEPVAPKRSLARLTSVEQCWACPSCTFLNPQSGNVCLMCSKPKGGVSGGGNSADKFEAEDVEELRKFHEEEATQQWEGIMAFCRNDRSQFVDDRFPPLQSSLFVGRRAPPEFGKVTGWLRPPQLRGLDPRTPWSVCRTPMASDIQQGFLGDCWFLCAMSVVAERPSLINNIIITRDVNREGAYLIRLCVGGLWKMILLDDLFPVEGRNCLAFSKAGRNQLWVPLIEKALAKAHGSYFSIEGGFVNEGLMFLTGAPCDKIALDADTTDTVDSVWAKLLSCHSAKFLMGASCGKPNESYNEQECLNMGLRPRHSYSVLDVQDIEGTRLIRLRDPWGRQAWKGDWSDNSKTWNPALRQALMPQGGSEGLFWISLPDFLKFFDCVDISKYREHWKEIRVQGAFPNNALHKNWSVWNMTVTETTEVDFTLYQQGYRGSSNESNAHHLDLLILVLACGADRRITKLVDASKRTTFSFVGTSCLLDPGHYIIWTLAFNHWNDMLLPAETFPKNVIAFHSGKAVAVERLSPPAYALADAIIFWAMRRGTRKNDQDGVTTYCHMHGGLVLVYENRHPNRGILLVCDCTKSRDTISTRGSLYSCDFIPPLTRMVVCILSPTHGSGFYVSFATKSRLCQPYENGLADWGPPGTQHFPETATELLSDLHSPRPLY